MARPPRLSRAEFEKLVEKAIGELPESFRSRLENVVIAVEDEPTDEDYELTGTPEDEDLFGIFRGPMRTEMSWDMLPTLPPQAVVFRGPILRNTSSNREAVQEIKDTLVHELGHYFGLEDDEMPY
ncbi:MAG TPA: metallopeptidase family protein [Thermoanaerobaculia bacterium]|nr:metallopeptidase family protein [Thermoanaerobaculia bacterium]